MEAHPEYASAPTDPVLPADATIGVAAAVGPLVMSLFGGVFLLVAITLLFVIRPPVLFSLVVLASGAALLVGGIKIARGLLAAKDAPIERITAVLVKERTEISGRNESTGTTSYATLQTRDGKRVEYRVSRVLVGKVVVDDIGIAYVKEVVFELGFTTLRSKSLVEFIRFEVDN